MSTIEFVSFLRSRAINLWVEGEQLCYGAPQGALTPALRAELGARKAELIAFLRQAGPDANVPQIRPALRNGPLPLSFAQQRLWFLDQLAPGSVTYTIPTPMRLTGALDLAALHASFSAIVRRHESLRTTFALHGEQPVQVIAAPTSLPLAVVDLQALPADARAMLAERLTAAETQRPFDLARGPLVRTTLLRLTLQEHIVLLTMHHIISDGWSVGVLIRELAAFYTANITGQPASLPDLPIQYADFAVWQQAWLRGADGADQPALLQGQLPYWTRQLAGAPPVLELPLDRPRPPIQTFHGARYLRVVPPPLPVALQTLSQRAGATLFMTLLAAFQVVLARHSGQDDIVVGTPIAGRTQRATEGLIGFFINTLVLRTDLGGNPSFLALLGRVREVCLAAYAHQDLPFEQLVDAMHPVRDQSRHPLFQVMFALQNAPMPALEVPGLTLRPVLVHTQTALFDLGLSFTEGPAGLVGAWEYNTDLFDAPTIRRMAGHFQTLLLAVVADPAQPVAALPLLSVAERQQLLHDWNATAATYLQNMCLQQLFELAVARGPDAIAISADGRHLTYQELRRRANQLAHLLRRHGVGPDVLVALCLARTPELAIGLLGVLKAGGAYVPLDLAYPDERLAFMVEDSHARVLITDSIYDLRFTIDDLEESQISIVNRKSKIVNLAADWSQIARMPTDVPISRVSAQHLAYVIYTSGSTGQPKGVAVTHQSVVQLIGWYQRHYVLSAAERTSQIVSPAFDACGLEMWASLINGTSLHVIDDATRADPRALRDWLIAQSITLCILPTPLAAPLISLPWPARLPLRTLLIGGDTFDQRPPSHLPFTLVNNYGPTETTILSTSGSVSVYGRADQPPAIGRPISNTQMYVLDGHMQPVPIGIPGELYIGGDGLARGYLNRPELTAERFVPNPFAEVSGAGCQVSEVETARRAVSTPDTRYPTPATRLYRTGDLVRYRADGSIAFLGRIDGQVKIRGYRIELGEIATLIRAHPDVQASVVLLREDRPGEKQLVAYVVPAETLKAEGRTMNGPEWSSSAFSLQRSALAAELRDYLKRKLPDYMVPSAFVVLDAFPLTTNGKLDRRALPAPAARRPADDALVAPRTLTEEIIAGIWAEVLGVAQVGIEDNFFAVGGHSLLATQVIARMRDAFQVELPLRTLFEAPTVAGLAAQLVHTHGSPVGLPPPIQPTLRGGPLPLAFAQQRLWFLDQLTPGSAVYTIPTPVRLIGALDLAALQASFTALVRRHETLRTTFALHDEQPVQLIAAPRRLQLAVLDVQALPADMRAALAQRLTSAEAQQPFDLARGPLIRTTLLRIDEQEHILLVTLHHIIADGWSVGVLIRDLAALYATATSGALAPLPELPIQYADYALWQQQWLQGAVLDAQLAYWTRQLAATPPALDLPLDRPRPPIQTFYGAQLTLVVPPSLLAALQMLSQRADVTLFMTLLAAFQVVLARHSGQDDLVVGTPIAGRTQRATEGLIGFFVNTLVLRTDLAGNPSFRTLLERVREVCLSAYAHQDLPFEQLVDAVQPVRDQSRHPLFQVLFALQNAPVTALEVPGLTLRPVPVATQIAKFDLSLSINAGPAGLVTAWEYNTDLFDATTIMRLAGQLQTLLASIVADPRRPLAVLPLLTRPEQQQLIHEWNASARPLPDASLPARLAAQAARTPDAVAASFATAQLTYAALHQRARQLAHALRRHGAAPDVLVALCVERSLDMLVGMLAILHAGAAYLPLDPDYPAARLAFMLADSQASILLTQQSVLAQLPPTSATTLCLDRDWPVIARRGGSRAAPTLPDQPDHDNLAYVIYTSGSTGRPKGVMVRQRGLLNLCDGLRSFFDHPQVQHTGVLTSISFDISVNQIFPTLLNGRTLHIVADAVKLDSAAFMRWVQQWRIQVLDGVPSYLQAVLSDLAARRLTTDLRYLLIGGEPLTSALLTALFEQLGTVLQVVNIYGLTEISDINVFGLIGAADVARPITVGQALQNNQVYLLDQYGALVPVGVIGEVCIAGTSVSRGYLGRPALTAEKFVPNPFAALTPAAAAAPPLPRTGDKRSAEGGLAGGEGGTVMCRTGDLGRRQADGRLMILGRRDTQVKIRGYRIELGEIEAALRSHADVREGAVVLRATASGVPRLVAYVVPTEDEGRRTKEIMPVETQYIASVRRPSSVIPDLRGFLQARLPVYMVPSIFVVLDVLPRTPNGKIDRAALPSPEGEQVATNQAYVAPRTPLEATVAELARQVLGIAQVGIHDNFFDLGGHSLLATRLVARLREQFAIELPLRSLFGAPTVAGLAEHVEALLWAAQEPLVLADGMAEELQEGEL